VTTVERWLTDTTPNLRFPVYTRLNAAEVLPDPVTPLGASLCWEAQILPGWAMGYVGTGALRTSDLRDAGAPVAAGFFYGHLYVNMTVPRVLGERMGIGAAGVDAAFFRTSEAAPPHVPQDGDDDDELTGALGAFTQWALNGTEFPELAEERTLADACRAGRPDLAGLTPAGLVARARSAVAWERLTWRAHVRATLGAATGPGIVARIVEPIDPALVLPLLGSGEGVDSAAPSYELWALSRLVRGDRALATEFDRAEFDGTGFESPGFGRTESERGEDGARVRLMAGLRDGHPVFAARFDRFLAAHGFHGPGEWDLGTPSWETCPELALALVDRLRAVDDSAGPADRLRARQKAQGAAMERVLHELRSAEQARESVRTAVASARRFAVWRERSKVNCVKVLHEARTALHRLGCDLAARGQLPYPELVFMALDGELDLLATDPGTLVATLVEREKRRRGLFGLDVPLFVEAGQPLPSPEDLRRTADRRPVPAARSGDPLRGVPCSPGKVRGRARHVRGVADFERFQPGEVLIAPHTDPSWTPLFMAAAGVVVEIGALASHAMIISREFGVPCVGGLLDALGRIPDGVLVEIDGATGVVTVQGE
jgi:phosphohistidine swiveling domain-containing protein